MLTGSDLLTVERTLQLAIAPAFVLGGVMAVLNLLTGRLQRVTDRERDLEDGTLETTRLRPLLRRRARVIYAAITACIVSSVMLCVLVIVSFLEPVFGVGAGTHVVALLILGMVSLLVALLLFLLEVQLSARGMKRGDP
ncbi:DUF2721 domain-containing protein [Falsiroseomonas sp. HW251]|uniref:DUF2721 domain-containing protein n=1 Tax=Falsiroseomonas sp. HW251 TaxID=3390998 RepID=UPI003D311D14